jgi:hypothetical protein
MITLNEAKNYLGTKAKYTFSDLGGNYILTEKNIDEVIKNGAKLIFRPLSDLILPCLPDGKIPIVELAKICYKNIYNYYPEIKSTSFFENGNSTGVIAYDEDKERLSFTYDVDITNNSFMFCMNGNTMFVNQLQLFEWLYEHHFWLGDQSRFGIDIIDINTI